MKSLIRTHRYFTLIPSMTVALLAATCGARSDLNIFQDPIDEPNDDPQCGNGIVEDREICDDGNESNLDGCVRCLLARCGDGFRSSFEACDDGNNNDTDECRNNCSFPSCGDGIVNSNEACDSPDPRQCTPRCLLPACGDGYLNPERETCDAGNANEDSPALELVQGSLRRTVRPMTTVSDATAFYAYRSASAHTGVEAVRKSRLLLHLQRKSNRLTLFTLHGIDRNESGISQGRGEVSQQFTGLPPSTQVLIADDNPDEFLLSSIDTAVGSWSFNDNTDGGVLGALAYPGSWTVGIASTFGEGIDAWDYVNQGPEFVSLVLTSEAFLVARQTPSACRLDCSIPRCGDGITDAGEVCDDGNTMSGDGCTGDCRSTE